MSEGSNVVVLDDLSIVSARESTINTKSKRACMVN